MNDETGSAASLLSELTALRKRVAELETTVAQRRPAEEHSGLLEVEEKFRALVETSSDWIWEVDAKSVYTYASPKVRDLLGYEPEEIVGKTPFDLMPPKEAARVASLMSPIMAAGVPFADLENLNRHKGGRLVYLETSGVPIFDAAGKLRGYRGIDRDVTERKRAAEALRESEEKHRLLFETMAQGVVYQAADGQVISANPAAERILGLALDQMKGRTPADPRWHTIHEDGSSFPGDEHPAMVALRTGQPVRNVVMGVFLPLERLHRWIVVNAIPQFRPGEASPFKVYATFTDITDLKLAEQTLREEFAFRNAVIECAAEGLCVWHEIVDFPHVAFTVWNRRMTEITGYTMEEINRSGWYRILYPDPALQTRVRDRMARMLHGDNPEGEESEITRSDGARCFVGISTSIIQMKAGEIHALTLMHDLTPRKRVEEERRKLEMQVQQAQKLESLGVLAGGIAHDFNNLLTAILGHANLASAGLPPESPARDNLRAVEKTSLRAAELCRQMLAYAGMGRFVLAPLNLSRVVQDLTPLLQVSISKKALLSCQFAENLPAVEIDPAQMRQVVLNLVINASEAIGDKEGIITISTGIVNCDEAYLRESHVLETLPPGTYVYLEVADTGCGMDDETKARIFDPFFTTKFAGRGLGLAAVLGIVRGQKGAIRVDSMPGKGATFRVLLPASKGAAEHTEPRESAVPWRGSGTILLVDDEDPVREVAQIILERLGFRVLAATDGREAVKLFRNHSKEIVCVLLDLTMPHMDGEEAYRELRKIRDDVRVILASGYNEQEITRRFDGKGLAGFIAKPFQVAALREKLREVLTDLGTASQGA
jgi:PAS domain S-box-containing protein